MKWAIWILAAVLQLLATQSCGNRAGTQQEDPMPVEKSDLTQQARDWADSVCATLTMRQKVAQLFLPAIYASDDLWTLRLVREYADSLVGGVVLLKGNAANAAAIADSLRKYSEVPPLISIDAEWGLAMRLADAPEFPTNHAIGSQTDDQLMYDYGRELARECRLLGINVVLGPVLDVSGPGSYMWRRSLGQDPVRVADLALAYARGLEDGNVMSVSKHFPGHGSVTTDSHKSKGVIHRSLHELESIDLYPFRRMVEQKLSAVMVGHLAVPSIDSQMRPAAVSATVIRDLLREDMKFDGLVFTDAINMTGAEGYTSFDAIEAGADIVVAPAGTFKEIDRVVAAVAEGRLAETEIDEHVRRLLFYKYLLSYDEDFSITADMDPRALHRQVSPEPGRLMSPATDSIVNLLRR